METKEIKIDSHDGYKYNSVLTYSAEKGTCAKIHYKDDGSIDEKKTYSKQYYEQLHPEENKKPEKKEKTKVVKTSSVSSVSSNYSSANESQIRKFFESKFSKFIFTVIPILLIWWIIKCPFSWISYPVRKSIKVANEKGNKVLPGYYFTKQNGFFIKLLGTIILILPIWWLIKLLCNILTFIPRWILNHWTINNDNFWPRYSFVKF